MKILRPAFLLALSLFGATTLRAQTETYSWTTIAGLAGAPGAVDGTNSTARFNFPAGITVDAEGNLFVTDLSNQTIRKVSPVGTDWVVSTIAGQVGTVGNLDGTNLDTLLRMPQGIAAAGVGNLYFTDLNHNLRQVYSAGTNWVVTTLAGKGSTGHADGAYTNASFFTPRGVALVTPGELVIADAGNFTIRSATFQTNNWVITTVAGTALSPGFVDGSNSAARLNTPFSIAVGQGGTNFVADFGNNAVREVRRIGPDWAVRTIAGFSGDLGSADGPGSVAAFNSPAGITVSANGVVFVSDQNNHTVRRLVAGPGDWMVDTIGGLALTNGSANGVGTAARFNQPWGIAVDSSGSLFVVDRRNHVIRRGTPADTRPVLQMARASLNTIVVSWPITATNYLLETKASIAGLVWSPITNGIALQGEIYYYTNIPTGTAGFFRLRKP